MTARKVRKAKGRTCCCVSRRRWKFQNNAEATKRKPGRPLGSRNKSTLVVENLLEGEAEKVTRRIIRSAMAGNSIAMKLVIDRIAPRAGKRPVEIELPKIETLADLKEATSRIVQAVASGELYTGRRFWAHQYAQCVNRLAILPPDRRPKLTPCRVNTDASARVAAAGGGCGGVARAGPLSRRFRRGAWNRQLVAGLDDVAVMREPVEQRGCHFGSPNTLGHSPKARLVVTMTDVRS